MADRKAFVAEIERLIRITDDTVRCMIVRK